MFNLYFKFDEISKRMDGNGQTIEGCSGHYEQGYMWGSGEMEFQYSVTDRCWGCWKGVC